METLTNLRVQCTVRKFFPKDNKIIKRSLSNCSRFSFSLRRSKSPVLILPINLITRQAYQLITSRVKRTSGKTMLTLLSRSEKRKKREEPNGNNMDLLRVMKCARMPWSWKHHTHRPYMVFHKMRDISSA